MLSMRRALGPLEAIGALRESAGDLVDTRTVALVVVRPEDCVGQLSALARLTTELQARHFHVAGLVLVDGEPARWRETVSAYELPREFALVSRASVDGPLHSLGINATPMLVLYQAQSRSFGVFAIPSGMRGLGAALHAPGT